MVQKWLIYTPEGTDQGTGDEKELTRWLRCNIQRLSKLRSQKASGKPCQTEKAWMGVHISAAGNNSRELPIESRLLARF